MDKKYKILWCTDSPRVNTGFGRVSQEVIGRLLETGKYEIHVMGTNDRGDPSEKWDNMKDLFIYPLQDFQGDPYGIQEFPRLLHIVKPDLVFALNDIWVWTGDEKRHQMDNWFKEAMKKYKPYVPWVAYFAVDGRPWSQRWVDLTDQMSKVIAMSSYGYDTLDETKGVDMDKVRLIPHGASIDKFFPIKADERKEVRKQFGIESDDFFLIGCVARNQPRKNIPRLIQIFKCFSDGWGVCSTCKHPRSTKLERDCELCGDTEYDVTYPGVGKENCALYLHMNLNDMRGHRLAKILTDNKVENLIFRQDHHVAMGVDIEELNRIYNAMDVMVLPSLAGGFELPIIEAQAAGTPVIATRSTAMSEHLDEGKGFPIIPDTHIVLEDANHCYKHIIGFKGTLDVLDKIYHDKEARYSVIPHGLAYASERNWEDSAKKFDDIFMEALNERVMVHEQFKSADDKKKLMIINGTKDPANLLTMIPTINAIREKYDPEIVIACDPKANSAIENCRSVDKFVDYNKLWLEDGVQIPNANIQDVTGVITGFVQNAARFSSKSWEEVWADQFKVDITDKKLEIFFDAKEKKYAKKMLPKTDKIRVGVCVDSTNPTMSLDSAKWIQLIGLMAKIDKFETVVLNSIKTPEMENAIVIDNAPDHKSMLACLDRCDIVVTLDNSFIFFAKALKKQIILIQGPRDATYKLKDYENYEIISKKEMFDCMPCWISVGQNCMVSNSQNSTCMQQITPVEIFGKVLTVFNKLKKKEDLVDIKG